MHRRMLSNARGDCRRMARRSDYVFPEREAYPIPTARCARYALTMATWPNNQEDAVEVARAVLERYGDDPNLRAQALELLDRFQLPLAANPGRRFRVGSRGPELEDIGHGRARRVGTRKQFDVRRGAGGVTASARSGRRDEYSGSEVDPVERYYVWVLDDHNQPLASEEPIGPMSLTAAKGNARIAAERGEHSRAVTRGLDPTSSSFEVVRVYSRRTGRRRV